MGIIALKMLGAKLVKVEAEGAFLVTPETKREFLDGIRRVCHRLDSEEQAFESPISGISIVGAVVEQEILREWAREGVPWDLSKPVPTAIRRAGRRKAAIHDVRVIDAFIVQQGATTGRADRILLVTQEVAHREQLEETVIRKVLRGRDVVPFRIMWSGLFAVFPYDAQGRVLSIGKGIWTGDAISAKEKVEELIAVGQVVAPRSALYLIRFYDELANRMFKGRNLREFGKEWFEWHRPRKPELVAVAPKIVGRRQIHEACFAVDSEGYLIMDSCLALVPRRSSDAWSRLVEYLEVVLGREPKEIEVLCFAAAILNHPVSDSLLKKGGTPQRGNYYSIGEEHLSRLTIPLYTTRKARATVRGLALGEDTDACPILL